jgi:hypothetical protein
MKIFEKIDRIPLRKFISYSSLLALFAALPVSVYMAKQQTRTRIGAAGDKYPALTVSEAEIPYPQNPPEIADVEKSFGKIGDSVLILGKNFGEVQKESYVEIGGIKLRDEETPFWSDNEIEAKIPAGAENGQVSVIINGRKATWDSALTIIQ